MQQLTGPDAAFLALETAPHIDIYVPHDQVRGRIDAALAASGRIVSNAHAPDWWTLADAEGKESDLAICG